MYEEQKNGQRTHTSVEKLSIETTAVKFHRRLVTQPRLAHRLSPMFVIKLERYDEDILLVNLGIHLNGSN